MILNRMVVRITGVSIPWEIAEMMFLAMPATMRAVARPGGRSTAGRPGWA
jgi:hypothetical protein